MGISVAIAAMIVMRFPRSTIGWIIIGLSLFWSAEVAADGLVYFAFVGSSRAVPGAGIALVWQLSDSSRFALVLITLLFLLFPNGRPLTPGWFSTAWVSAAAAMVHAALALVRPDPDEGYPGVANPYGIDRTVWAPLEPVMVGADFVLGVCMLLAAASLFVRMRSATGEVRQQLKWFLFAAAFFPFSFLVMEFAGPALRLLGLALQFFTISGMVAATAVAVFRYRLYDIDLIINRTLVYGLLTGALAAVYFTGVTSLQQLFLSLSGQGSELAVVISTLAIAALFNPLRRRIQAAIDRRFYRRRYNAEKALESIAETARDEVDLERLARKILTVVEDTMQPERVSLWVEMIN